MRGWSSVSKVICFGLIAGLTIPSHAADARDPDQMVFGGVQAFDSQDLRTALRFDFNAVLAGHPDGNSTDFLRTVESTLLQGYQHCGFRSARVAAAYDSAGERVIVRIEEGPRHFCGKVRVDGCKAPRRDSVLACLTFEDDPDKVLWQEGHPAPFDDLTLQLVRERVGKALSNDGFYSAKVAVEIVAHPDQAALLVIRVEEGPQAEVGQIVVTGNTRDDAPSILQFLGLKSGQSLNSLLMSTTQRRLLASGRFLECTVHSARDEAQSNSSREIHSLFIDVAEFQPAPPLAERLSLEEQTVLKVADWMQRWSRGEVAEDIVITATGGPVSDAELEEAFGGLPFDSEHSIRQLALRMTMTAKRGATLTLKATDSHDRLVVDQVMAFSADGLVLGSPMRQARLSLPPQETKHVVLSCGTGAGTKASRAESGRLFGFTFGLSLQDKKTKDVAPLEASVDLLPASLLQLVRGEGVECTTKDGRLRIHGPNLQTEIDVATGRPLTFTWRDPHSGAQVAISTEPGAMAVEARRLNGLLANATTTYESPAAWRCLVEYCLDEWCFALDQRKSGALAADRSREQAAGWRAVRKLIAAWNFSGADSVSDKSPSRDAARVFKLPNYAEFEIESLYGPDSPSRRTTVGYLLGIHRKLAPKSGWFWPIGRDLVLWLGSDSELPVDSLWAAPASPEIGPIGQWVLTTLNVDGAAEAGWRHHSVDAFRRDYQPLLDGNSWLSKCVLSLAEASRALDERELRDLASLIEPGPARDAVASALIQLKSQSEQPIAESLAAALDLLWQRALSARFGEWFRTQMLADAKAREALLLQTLGGGTPVKENDLATSPLRSQVEPQTPLSEQFERLVELEKEISKPSGGEKNNLPR